MAGSERPIGSNAKLGAAHTPGNPLSPRGALIVWVCASLAGWAAVVLLFSLLV